MKLALQLGLALLKSLHPDRGKDAIDEVRDPQRKPVEVSGSETGGMTGNIAAQ